MPFSSFHDYTPLQSRDAPQRRSSHDDKADALGPGLNNSGLKWIVLIVFLPRKSLGLEAQMKMGSILPKSKPTRLRFSNLIMVRFHWLGLWLDVI